MVDLIDYWSYLPNILDDLKALSKHRKSESFTETKVLQRPRSGSTNVHSVRNSVCVAGIDRDSVLAVKKQVYRLLSGRCALESFHFRNGDDIKDGALFVPKVILVAVFQPGRKLIDDSGDEGQLDEAYDEIFENGAELMLIYLDLPKLVYPINTRNLYHVRLEQLVFPEQTIVKNLAGHGLLLTLTENSRKLNQVQEQRLLEWLLSPVDPMTHPVFKACALFNALQPRVDHGGFGQLRASFTESSFQKSYQNVEQGRSGDEFFQFKNSSRATHSSPERGWSGGFTRQNQAGSSSQLLQNPPRRTSTSEDDDDDDDDDQEQMKRHGFMTSMESYPLLKRNSRSRKKKLVCGRPTKDNGTKSCKKNSRISGAFQNYGSVVKKEGQVSGNPFLA